jgi:hypothetical protein
MQTATRPTRVRLRPSAVLAISTVIALVAALLAYGTVKPVAAASTHVFVDTAPPSVVHRTAYPVSGLIQRAELLGRVATSPPMVEQIARIAGVPADQVGAEARTTARVPAAFTEPASEERASDILTADLPYRIEVQARLWSPILDVYTRAPSTTAAEGLADAAVAAMEQRIRSLADDDGLAASDRVVLRQLGPARGGFVNPGMAIGVGVVTFVVVLALAFAALWFLIGQRGSAVLPPPPERWSHDVWPHTTRLVPWTLAVFLAVVWLVPFNSIQLNMQLPIDLGFDRLVLPVVVATWVLAVLVGGRAAPRLRLTWIHAGVGAFVTCAFLSVILNAGSLNQSLELEGALKRLPLLISYVSLFVIASSAVRSVEIRAFLSYTLALAVICALGVLWEYRFKQNLFYEWSDKLLPGIFQVGKVDAAAVDDIGRRVVRGPADVPLETVAMLAMALPIPLVRLTESEAWRDRLLYGFAACVIFAAAFATFRKSALLAPVSVILTLAYFRRRELLKLSPLALVLVVLIPALAPGAVGMTTTQFEPSRLGAATVSDRAADYDAIRPDVWTHLLMGKGWGSYEHVAYRILDSEGLHRLIEMGVLGLLAFVFMVGSVIGAARATIGDRDRTWAPLALIGTAAAVSFGVVSTLFDVMSFPHGVYIFLYVAGLVAAVASRHRDGEGLRRERHIHVAPARDSAEPLGRASPSPALFASAGHAGQRKRRIARRT